jgi:hemerythrin
MIAWDDAMQTGFPEIDVQHKELIEQFNELAAAIEMGKGREETGKILDFLQFYAQWHFEREEHCMDAHRCPVAMANRSAHRQFLDRFGDLYEHYQQSDIDPHLVNDTFVELETWIVNHILRVDTRLRECPAD